MPRVISQRQLTWRKHIQSNRQHLDVKLRATSWLLGRRSHLSLPNQLLLYKCILKPVWTYGIQLWGCAKPCHTQILQPLQSKILRYLANAPLVCLQPPIAYRTWYTIRLSGDLQILPSLPQPAGWTSQHPGCYLVYAPQRCPAAKVPMAI